MRVDTRPLDAGKLEPGRRRVVFVFFEDARTPAAAAKRADKESGVGRKHATKLIARSLCTALLKANEHNGQQWAYRARRPRGLISLRQSRSIGSASEARESSADKRTGTQIAGLVSITPFVRPRALSLSLSLSRSLSRDAPRYAFAHTSALSR